METERRTEWKKRIKKNNEQTRLASVSAWRGGSQQTFPLVFTARHENLAPGLLPQQLLIAVSTRAPQHTLVALTLNSQAATSGVKAASDHLLKKGSWSAGFPALISPLIFCAYLVLKRSGLLQLCSEMAIFYLPK